MRAHALMEELRASVSEIAANPIASHEQLNPLWKLQKLLTKEIIRAERKIRRSKSILREIDGSVEPERAAGLEERIELFRQSAYIWRCFGDAIAFLFMDKFALKQTYYNTANVYPKQDAGFLADKVGLAGEWEAVEGLLSKGFPALLTDLTNTIRYRDVCALLGSVDICDLQAC